MSHKPVERYELNKVIIFIKQNKNNITMAKLQNRGNVLHLFSFD